MVLTHLTKMLDSKLFTPQLAGKARQLGCPKIDCFGSCVCIYIYKKSLCLCAPQHVVLLEVHELEMH